MPAGSSAFPIEIVYVLISFLLLTGLFHLETLLKERLRMEAVEKKLREDLEYQVKRYTAQLNRTLDELKMETRQRKKLQAQFNQTEEELVDICRGPGTPYRSIIETQRIALVNAVKGRSAERNGATGHKSAEEFSTYCSARRS